MHILISNDDGHFATGIKTLIEVLEPLAKISVVAPDRDCSGSSNSLTLNRPLLARRAEKGHYVVDGTPVDCMHLALAKLLQSPPDLIVSGINAGANMGDDVLYSGTVAAAMEGYFSGCPAIACSIDARHPKHWDSAGCIASELVQALQENPLPRHLLLNLNIPDRKRQDIHGLRITRLGQRQRSQPIVNNTPRGLAGYWIGPPGMASDTSDDTDFHCVAAGYASLTPLSTDLTKQQHIPMLKDWLKTWR